ncbi:MAG: 5-valerolactone hydrolase [Actinomycetia bacterium]|nr:5-valerolactone hydrolase [Actinomycetes bacterium]
MVKELDPTLIADGFVLGEGPRWHDDRLWFSDIFDGKIYSLREPGGLSVEVEVGAPSGLGWLPDGSLLVATLAREEGGALPGPALLLRVDADGVHTFVEAADRNTSFNDMVVLPHGQSYLNLYRGTGQGDDEIVLVEPGGEWRSVAAGLFHPNGMAVTPDGRTLIVSETHANRVSSFAIDERGDLAARRDFATGVAMPDGLCLDAEGAVWVGSLFASEFLRITDGGAVTHRVPVPTPYWALAPMLGGPGRQTLYLLAADTTPARASRLDSSGYLYGVDVDVPGAGWPW